LCLQVLNRETSGRVVSTNDPSLKANDLFYQNAIWFIFVSSTTVGYGDITPSTHLGRIIASISIVVGLVMTALLTAALANALELSYEEYSAINLCDREIAKQTLMVKAVKIVQIWWKRRQLRREGLRAGKKIENYTFDVWKVKQEFKRAQKQVMVEVEDNTATMTKIDSIAKRMKSTCKVLDGLADRLWLGVPMPGYDRMKESVIPGFESLLAMEKAVGSTKPPAGSWKKKKSPMAPISARGEQKETDKTQRLQSMSRMGSRDQILTLKKARSGGIMDWINWLRSPALEESARGHTTRNPWTSREAVDQMKINIARQVAFFGVLGLIASVIQNELMFRNVEPAARINDILKIVCTATTAVTVLLLYRYYWYSRLFNQISKHIDKGADLDTRISWNKVLSEPGFWAEFIVVAVHLPPFITFEVAFSSMDNAVVYRIETLATIWVSLRLYLLWRCTRDWNLQQMPKRHTVSRFTRVPMNSALALKRLLSGFKSVFFIGVIWCFTLGVLGYWYRLFEVTACKFEHSTHSICDTDEAQYWTLFGTTFRKENDLYLQNSLWFMFVTSTTVGYGETVPGTHMGRTVAATVTLLGINYCSLLTAALSNALSWSPEEKSALNLCNREQARSHVQEMASAILGLWWKRRSAGFLTKKQRAKLDRMKRLFASTIKIATMDIEDCADTTVKIDTLAQNARHVESASFAIFERLWPAAEEEESQSAAARFATLKTGNEKMDVWREKSEERMRAAAIRYRHAKQKSFVKKVMARVEKAGSRLAQERADLSGMFDSDFFNTTSDGGLGNAHAARRGGLR